LYRHFTFHLECARNSGGAQNAIAWHEEFSAKAGQGMNQKLSSTIVLAMFLIGAVSCSTKAPNVPLQGELVSATSGTPQSHTINGAFAAPLVVTVTTSGLPTSGVVVSFAAPTTGASGKFVDTGTRRTTATTDANGVATSASFIANGTVGAYSVTAAAQGVETSISFSLTNTTGAPASVLATGGIAQSAGINTTYAAPLVVKVVDSGQNPVQFAMVAFTAPASGASGTFADTGTNTTGASTDANGVATSPLFTANAIAGTNDVTATVAGASTPATFNLTNLSGSAVTITATSGTPQKAVIGSAFSAPLVATVFDGFLNPVSGVPVTFSAPASSASGTFSNGTTTETDITDASGMATSSAFSANGTAGGPYIITASIAGGPAPADFDLTNTFPFKTYVFSLNGEEVNTASFYALVGAVQIDTAGNVVAGEQDYNDGGFGIASPEPSGDMISGGTLQVNSTTGQGTLVLNTDNLSLGVGGTETLGIQFANVNHALITQFDGTATSSGSMDLQTLPTTLNGGFAFAMTGLDPNFSPVAFGGVFTISGGTSLQNGVLDTNDAATGTITTGSSLTGTLSTPDSFGRGTINSTMNYTTLVGFTSPVVLNYYIVGPEVLRIIDVDSQNNGSASSDTAIGSAFGQGVNATAATNASVGSSVFGIAGNTFSQFAAAGMFATDSPSGTFTGVADENELSNGFQVPDSPISGNYSIASNGYGNLTIAAGSLGDLSVLGMYLTDPNLNLSDPNNTSTGLGGAVLAGMDPSLSGGIGVVVAQTDTSVANFTGKYVLGGQAFAFLTGSGEFDFIGQGNVKNLILSGTGLVSDPFLTLNAQVTNSGAKFSGAPLADASNPGRYTMSSTNPTPNPFRITTSPVTTEFDVAIYQASGGQLLWLNVDLSSVFLGSLQQQGVLNPLPAKTCCKGLPKN